MDAPSLTTTVSIATPSYNQLDWLGLCIRSVADQCVTLNSAVPVARCHVEHVIFDGGSKNLQAFCLDLRAFFSGLPSVTFVESLDRNELLHVRMHDSYSFRLFSQSDHGMYDAINKCFSKANGQIFAWLNSDEQLLPGTVGIVADYFTRNPSTDVVVGDAILLDRSHQPLTYRRIIRPNRWHTKLDHLHSLSCSMFFRRASLPAEGLDTRWKIISDALLMDHFLGSGMRIDALRIPLAVYHFTGSNLSEKSRADAEMHTWWAETRFPPRWLRPVVVALHRLARLAAGSFKQRLAEVPIYTSSDLSRRQLFSRTVGGTWPRTS
jgi:glycosyltransferase involved in cell wall biosynthesis